MTITVENLVSREVHYCVSSLVAGIAETWHADSVSETLDALHEQAQELCSPIDDWEEAAIQAGWSMSERPQADGYWLFRKTNQRTVWKWTGQPISASWAELCEYDGLEPYQREVYEHWIVSDWLADRLAEKGEKVDKDFAGLTVWARTTTGQGIASDSVIEAIHADLVREA